MITNVLYPIAATRVAYLAATGLGFKERSFIPLFVEIGALGYSTKNLSNLSRLCHVITFVVCRILRETSAMTYFRVSLLRVCHRSPVLPLVHKLFIDVEPNPYLFTLLNSHDSIDNSTSFKTTIFLTYISMMESLENLTLRYDSDSNSYKGIRSVSTLKTELNVKVIYSLSFLPSYIFNSFNKLEELNIINTKITSLPDSLGSLQNLVKINLSINSRLARLPSCIGKLKKLKILTLRNNNFSSLPSSIERLTNLEEIDISGNRFTHLPDFFLSLKKLRKLILENCNFSSLPSLIGQLTNLEEIDISGNHFTHLPDFFLSLKKLRKLILQNCNFSSLPSSIEQLTNLKEIDISGNRFTHLPDFLSKLPSTCTISAENNQLSLIEVTRFQNLIRNVRATDPNLGPQLIVSTYEPEMKQDQDLSLEKNLLFWSNAYSKAFPQSPKRLLTSFTQTLDTAENSNHLALYLQELKNTADFKNENSKNSLITDVYETIALAAENKEFRDELFTLLQNVLGTCGDRTSYARNEVETLYQLHHVKDITECMKVVIGIVRRNCLRPLIEKRIVDHQIIDPLEAYLYYELKIGKVLGIPGRTLYMHYENLVCNSRGITNDMLEQDKNEVLQETSDSLKLTDELLKYKPWLKWVDKTLENEIELIRNEAYKIQEELDSKKKTLTSRDYNEKSKQVVSSLDENLDKIRKEKTHELLTAHFAKSIH